MAAGSNDLDFDLDAVVGPASDRPSPPALDIRDTPRPVRLSRSPRRGLRQWAAPGALRRRWLAASIVFLAVCGASATWAFTRPSFYEARARVVVEATSRFIVPFRQLTDDNRRMVRDMRRGRRWRSPFDLNVRVRNPDVARRALDETQLWDQFRRADAARVNDERSPDDRAIQRVLANMRVSQVGASRLLDIRFRARDPVLAQRMANGLAIGFISMTMDERSRTSVEAVNWLDERLEELRKEVQAAEEAVQRHRERHGAVAARGSDVVMRRLLALNAAATDARTLRIEKEVLQRQLEGGVPDGAVSEAFPGVFDQPALQRARADLAELEREEAELSSQLGDRHPRLQAVRRAIDESSQRLETEIEKSVEAVRNQYRAAVAQEEQLQAALRAGKADALAMERAGIELGVLIAERDSARRLYTSLLRRREQLQITTRPMASGLRVVDAAELPTRPLRTTSRRTVVLGFALALAMAMGTALVLDSVGRTLRTPEEVRHRTGLATLALLPPVPALPEGKTVLVDRGAPPGFEEAVRQLRTNLRFAVSAADGARVIVVTSTEPGEGKSTVAANLAFALAAEDERVLLVDADMRRPTLHIACGQERTPGLSNLLAGLSEEAVCLHATGTKGLTLLPAGDEPPNPSELLLSRAFTDRLQAFRERFDWVLLDGPPVLAVTDPCVVASQATAVLFVVRGDKTGDRRARFALEQLTRVHARVAGVAINRSAGDVA